MTRTRWIVTVVLAMAVGALAMAQLGKILKGGAVTLAVDKFGPEMNRAINKVTNTTDTKAYSTKVVPIISIGSNAFAGAAQIMGPPKKVAEVQAIAQIETKFSPLDIRLRGLIPISTKNPGRDLKRVVGVGISGLIDIKL